MNAGSLCTRHVNYGNTINVFFYFSEKRHKIVEFLSLLTTELSSYKMCKVGMLFKITFRVVIYIKLKPEECKITYFALFRLQFNVNYNTERFRESFLNVH